MASHVKPCCMDRVITWWLMIMLLSLTLLDSLLKA